MDRFFLATQGTAVSTSAVLTVASYPVMVRVYGLPGNETIHWQVVEEVIDLEPTGARCFGVNATARVAQFATYFRTNGCMPSMGATYTTMYLNEPGSYRAIISPGAVGAVTIIVQEDRLADRDYTSDDLGCHQYTPTVQLPDGGLGFALSDPPDPLATTILSDCSGSSPPVYIYPVPGRGRTLAMTDCLGNIIGYTVNNVPVTSQFTSDSLLSVINGMTPAQHALLCGALNCGSGTPADVVSAFSAMTPLQINQVLAPILLVRGVVVYANDGVTPLFNGLS
jgi:hypothetical protein